MYPGIWQRAARLIGTWPRKHDSSSLVAGKLGNFTEVQPPAKEIGTLTAETVNSALMTELK